MSRPKLGFCDTNTELFGDDAYQFFKNNPELDVPRLYCRAHCNDGCRDGPYVAINPYTKETKYIHGDDTSDLIKKIQEFLGGS